MSSYCYVYMIYKKYTQAKKNRALDLLAREPDFLARVRRYNIHSRTNILIVYTACTIICSVWA